MQKPRSAPGLDFLHPIPTPTQPDEDTVLGGMELEFRKPIDRTLWQLWAAHIGVSKARLARIIEPSLATDFLKAARQHADDVPSEHQSHLKNIAYYVAQAHPQHECCEESQSESESESESEAESEIQSPAASSGLDQQQKHESLERFRGLCEDMMSCMEAWKAEKAAKDRARERARCSGEEQPMRPTAGKKELKEAVDLATWMWCAARDDMLWGPDRARFAGIVRRLRLGSIADDMLYNFKVRLMCPQHCNPQCLSVQ